MTVHLASAPDASRLFSDLLPWLGLLIAMVVIGGIVLYLIRRSLNRPDGAAAEPFTLEDLRRMRAQGQMTDDEFEKARAAMIGRLTERGNDGAVSDNGDAARESDVGEGGSDGTASGNGPVKPDGD